MVRRQANWLFVALLFGTAAAAACGSDETGAGGDDGRDGGPAVDIRPQPGDLDAAAMPIDLSPKDQALTFVSGQPAPTLQLQAKLLATGEVVPATFAIDRGEIGTVGATTGLFTAAGKAGGKATVTATWRGATATTSVAVRLRVVDNGGPPTSSDAGAGAGGNGGVGGAGPGGPVDPATIAVLKGTATPDANLGLLYPYTGTVWPRGILAPLLQWNVGAQGDYDAVLVSLKETFFEYEGTFAKNAAPFKNHPVGQQVWKQLLASNTGEDVAVSLVFAKSGAAYGPLTSSWKVAAGPLKGTVYYNSYGTNLAKNYDGALPDSRRFGGATLAIKGSSTDPVLVAGGTGDSGYCRVCHSVAANGSVLLTQRREGGDKQFSTYDLKTGVETKMLPEGTTAANYAWPAIYPDGTLFLGDSSSAIGSSDQSNQLYQVVSGGGSATPTAVTMNGWPAGFRAAFPAFSHDGRRLAFTMFGGAAGADEKTIGAMTFDKASSTFGPIQTVFKPGGGLTAVYPSFLPTSDSVIFHVETRGNGRDYGGTRGDGDSGGDADVGARAELWWATVPASGTPVAARLDKLNGVGYLPSGPDGHDADATLNYEPTVNPVPSGGYAWVVFTSRRRYGNVATMNPFHSDPRNFDLTTDATTKKLWVAAIDLNAPPGSDPSHPAFYLPAQELLAGNARGYWVVDPCKADAVECETGDECCGGFCRPDASGKLVCSNVVPACAQEFERCNTAADCCNSLSQCINNRCASASTPK
ncbi:MAG: PD40 domain-containing protein [Myxococcales bacterium]|nr:PD40 domain-containing protein [Myxococcales bacterium]